MKKVLTLMTLLTIAYLSNAQQPGWHFEFGDAQSSRYYPYPSTIQTGNLLCKKSAIAQPNLYYMSRTLIGDVNGDGFLELVFASNSTLRIFDHNCNQLYDTSSLLNGIRLSLLEDVNNDGIKDIGIGSENCGNPLQINFYNASGSVIKTFSKAGSGSDIGLSPLCILHGNKLIAAANAGYSLDPRGISAFDIPSGNELWFYDLGSPTPGQISIANINNNGVFKIALPSYTVHNGHTGYGYNGLGTITTDGDLWTVVINENGVETFSNIYPAPSDGVSIHKFVDFNNNGFYKLLAEESHDPYYYPGQSQLHLLNTSNGSEAFYFNGGNDMGWSSVICDINNDGIKEVVTTNSGNSSYTQYIFDNTLTVLKSSTIPGTISAAADLNGDGKIEIIMKNGNIMKVLDDNLNLISSITFATELQEHMIVSDLDSNGINNIIVMSSDSIFNLEFLPATGINEISSQNNVSIYPNPATDNIIIEAQLKAIIEITNMQGKLLKTIETTGSKTNVDVSAFASGLYFVKVIADNGIVVRKVVKE